MNVKILRVLVGREMPDVISICLPVCPRIVILISVNPKQGYKAIGYRWIPLRIVIAIANGDNPCIIIKIIERMVIDNNISGVFFHAAIREILQKRRIPAPIIKKNSVAGRNIKLAGTSVTRLKIIIYLKTHNTMIKRNRFNNIIRSICLWDSSQR